MAAAAAEVGLQGSRGRCRDRCGGIELQGRQYAGRAQQRCILVRHSTQHTRGATALGRMQACVAYWVMVAGVMEA